MVLGVAQILQDIKSLLAQNRKKKQLRNKLLELEELVGCFICTGPYSKKNGLDCANVFFLTLMVLFFTLVTRRTI